MGAKPSERLTDLGLSLPPPPSPAGTYSPVLVHDGWILVSGQIVTRAGKAVHPGRVGAEVDPEVAKQLAQDCVLQALSWMASALGSIDQIGRVLRVAVYVASAPGFDRTHEVANGATDLLVSLFGEAGRPARVAMGVQVLPLNAPVEVELMAAVA